MKKISLLLFLIFICLSCNKTKSQSEIENDKKLIDGFIQNIIMKANNNYEEIDKLTTLYNHDPNNKTKKQLDSLAYNILRKSNKEYQIYLDIYNKNKDEKNKILEMVNLSIMSLEKSIKSEKWDNYKIVHYKEVESHSEIKNSKIYSTLEFNKLNSVYFSIFDNNPERVGIYIVENNKIISFFPHLVFGVGSTKPYLLNKKQNGF